MFWWGEGGALISSSGRKLDHLCFDLEGWQSVSQERVRERERATAGEGVESDETQRPGGGEEVGIEAGGVERMPVS